MLELILGWPSFMIVGENGRTLKTSEGARFQNYQSRILKLRLSRVTRGVTRLELTSFHRDLSIHREEPHGGIVELGMRHLERKHR
jgi:hypothetical protein